ncbi:MAG: glycosyltransferase [Patescibacteria group bacterium]
MVKSLSVVIPAYNEEKNIATCLENVYSVLKDQGALDWEIIVVNDGSKDQTGTVAKSYLKKIPNLKIVENRPNRGYGGSLKRGFQTAKKDFIVMAHSDNQFDFNQLHDLIAKQEETQADIVSGIRPSGGHDPIHRLFFRWGWNTLIRALFGYLATDVDCGFKLFSRDVLKRVSLPSDGAMVDTQLFAGARARGIRIAEIEVKHLPRTAGSSTGGNPKVILKALMELFIFWWQLKKEIMVEQGRAVFRWEAVWLALILVIGGFLRLWNIDQHMTFLGDEGRDAIVMRDMVTGNHFPLIGPGTSIGSMYLGPLYYYLMAPALWIAGESPAGPSIFVALIGLLTIGLLWWVVRQWANRVPALLVSALYAISPTIIMYSRSSWNPNIMPFFALLTIYSVWKASALGYWRWVVIGAVSFAFVLNSHYLGLLLAPTIFAFLFISKRNTSTKRYLGLSILVLVMLMSPLFFFDLRHNWINSKALKLFFTDRQTTVNLKAYKAIPNLWPIWLDFNISMFAAKNKSVGLGSAIVIPALLGLYLVKNASRLKSKDLAITLTWLVFGLIGLGLYKQHIYDHYMGFIYPAVFILLAFILEYLMTNRYLSKVIFVIFVCLVYLNLSHTPLLSGPNHQLERTRQVAELIHADSQGNPYNLALLAKSNYDASYKYFLYQLGSPIYTIHENLSDQLYVICEMSDCQPIGNALWEVAAFGWAKIDRQWEFPWGVKLYRLVPNPEGKSL